MSYKYRVTFGDGTNVDAKQIALDHLSDQTITITPPESGYYTLTVSNHTHSGFLHPNYVDNSPKFTEGDVLVDEGDPSNKNIIKIIAIDKNHYFFQYLVNTKNPILVESKQIFQASINIFDSVINELSKSDELTIKQMIRESFKEENT